MSKFIKLKQESGKRLLIDADSVVVAVENGSSTTLTINTGDQYEVQESYQTVVNRLTKDGKDE